MAEPTQAGSADWDELAALVRDAGDYVGVSPQLRPRVVEAVSRVLARRRAVYRLGCAAAVSLALTAGLAAIGQRWQPLTPPRGVTSEQLHRWAGERAKSAGVGFEWALADVVTDWRTEMAGPPGCGSVLNAGVDEERSRR